MHAGSMAVWVGLFISLVAFIGEARADRYQRLCYLDTMAQRRDGVGWFSVDDLGDLTLCTHLVFVHALINASVADLVPAMQEDYGYYQVVTRVKEVNPALQVLLLVGGPDPSHSALFSEAVNSTEVLDALTPNVLSYLVDFGFDGIELDWRYPGVFGSIPSDVMGFSTLVRRLNETFAQHARQPGNARLTLNVRVSGDTFINKESLQLTEIAKYADYLIVTAYDFYNSIFTDAYIGHNSGILGRFSDPPGLENLNVDHVVQNLTKYQGIPAERIILGIPSFGRTVILDGLGPDGPDFGTRHLGPGPAGAYTREPGVLAYYEICSMLRNGWTEVMDQQQLTPYAFSDTEMVTYDNPESVASKANYIKEKGLGGAALWDLSTDDFSGQFCEQGRFPLANALRTTFLSPRTYCPAGLRGHLDEVGCVPCPAGTFQPSQGTMECIDCPEGLTTLTSGATQSYKCIPGCASGTEYSHATSSCSPCPLGYFRVAGRDAACLKCSPGYTTVSASSTGCVIKPVGVPEVEPRQIDVIANVTFTTTSCENRPVIVGAVREVVAGYFQSLAQVWAGLCDDASCDNVVSDVTQGCEGGSYARKRRQADETLLVTIRVANVSEEVQNADSTQRTKSVIAAALSDKVEFEPLSTYGIRFSKIQSLDTQIVCEPGSAESSGRCEECEAGSYHNVTLSTCAPCPVGHYQHVEAQRACWPCSGVLSTAAVGAASPDLCVSPCEARPNFCYNDGVCHWTEADQGSVYCECGSHYQGERCLTPTGEVSSRQGTVVGAVVGGVLAFLIIVLILIACCVCYRVREAVKLHSLNQRLNSVHSNNHTGVRKAVKLRSLNERQNSVHSNNRYTTWGTFSRGNSESASRGVKFVDYIDYYMWLNSVSDQNQTAQQSYRKTRTSQPATTRSKVTSTTLSGDSSRITTVNNVTTNTNTNGVAGVAETNIDKPDHAEHIY